MTNPANLFWDIAVAFLLVGILTFILGKRKNCITLIGWLLLALLCLLNTLLAGSTLLSGNTLFLGQFSGIWPLGAWPWQLDALSSLFLLLLSLLGFWVCLYSAGSTPLGRTGTGPSAVAMVSLQFFFTQTLLTAQNGLSLLIAWEGMSLTAFAYILADHTRRNVRRAAYMTIVISELGFLALVVALLLPSHSHLALDFPTIRQALQDNSPVIRLTFFWLCFLGFGVKSGVLPVQLWLPRAYTVVPGNLGALLAGGLVNLGLFGILRVYFSLLGGLGDGSAFLLVLLGALGTFLGALYAVIVRDLRRVLGYSSIENIGLMILSFGLAVLFFNHGEPAYAGLSLLALFLQMISHTLAKGLAFLDSGEVQALTGRSNLDILGGLHRTLPVVSVTFLIASLSLAAVAPFTGFAAEWLNLQSLLQVYHGLPQAGQILAAITLILLGLGAALAFTAFLRLYLYIFAGRPHWRKSETGNQNLEAEVSGEHQILKSLSKLSLIGLAGISVLAGFFPTAVLNFLSPLISQLSPSLHVIGDIVPPVFRQFTPGDLLPKLGGRLLAWLPLPGAVVQPPSGVASIAPTYVLFWFLIFAVFAFLLFHAGSRPYKTRTVNTWTGGLTNYGPASQYSATAYANPYRMLLGRIGNFKVTRNLHRGTSQAPLEIGVQADMLQILSARPYEKVFRSLRRRIHPLAKIQHGFLSGYVAYILIFLILVLFWAAYSR
ncbi:proton-conducting transporter membrane subunit [Desulfosporosinus sp. PR]|uniref:proton-conducting transporter transmembrane domain-containing protein n=1 Tax=Candidatus Desulfosporosinus nitrosoreducens TaxID=3401928 RepID=UPI0027FDD96A|nr:proton-conducting transporter membrane subunit [Desulfosporosinus sp. PR]MDQ7092351.1 proton-conducting transporter membrane subunit [Desulfosporosinus sp. PR]